MRAATSFTPPLTLPANFLSPLRIRRISLMRRARARDLGQSLACQITFLCIRLRCTFLATPAARSWKNACFSRRRAASTATGIINGDVRRCRHRVWPALVLLTVDGDDDDDNLEIVGDV